MNNEITILEFEPVVKQSGLDKAENYAAIFAPFMITLKELSNKAESINKTNPSVLDAKLAREVRLAMSKNRTASEKIKDSNKASLLAEGNLIQNLYNVIANASKLSEADLDAVEKFAENKEKERKAALAIERAAMFTEYGTDLTGYDLGSMNNNTFADLLESQKLLHEKRIADAARIEAEKIEAERLELERQAALKAENDRLKKEQEKAAAALEAERKEAARLAKIEQDKADALAAENAAKLAAIEAENKKVREKAAAELKASQDAAAKAQAELQAKKEAERKIEQDKIAAAKKAAKAPDKEKLQEWIKLCTIPAMPVLKDDSMQTVATEILVKFGAYKKWALQQIETI